MTILTKNICKKETDAALLKDFSRYTLELYDTMVDIEEEWSSVAAAQDVFFDADFLRCIETCPATGIKPYYCLVKEKDTTVGIIYFQNKYVTLRENLRPLEETSDSITQKLVEPIKQAVIGALNFETIICGNLLLTGNYGFYFKGNISRDEQFYIVIKAAERLQLFLKKENKEPGLVLIKDFFANEIPAKGEYHKGFVKFSVQPKMILDLRPEWKTFDDYLESLKSKYRVRARKALEKSRNIIKKVFDIDDIATHRDRIHVLYKNVSDQADFNAFLLHPQYFEKLKQAFGKNMTFTTYWLEGEMIAFFTSIKNYDVLDAHFLGYDNQQNTERQLYLNMLYDLIREGIEKNVRKVDLSRTAVEIKSTVGARPHDMYLYLKHTNSIVNKTAGSVLQFVKPDTSYIIRSPFRDA